MAFCSSTARVGRDIDASPERVSDCFNEFVSRHLADRHVDKRATDSFSCRFRSIGQSHHFLRNYTWRFHEAWVVVLVSRPRIVLVGKPSVRVSLSPLFAMDPLEHGTPCHTSNGFHKLGYFFGRQFWHPCRGIQKWTSHFLIYSLEEARWTWPTT